MGVSHSKTNRDLVVSNGYPDLDSKGKINEIVSF
jgi:hypothetical protein